VVSFLGQGKHRSPRRSRFPREEGVARPVVCSDFPHYRARLVAGLAACGAPVGRRCRMPHWAGSTPNRSIGNLIAIAHLAALATPKHYGEEPRGHLPWPQCVLIAVSMCRGAEAPVGRCAGVTR